MGATTIGGLIGAGIDSLSGDDDSSVDGALIGAATANILKLVLPVIVTYAVGWMTIRGIDQLRAASVGLQDRVRS